MLSVLVFQDKESVGELVKLIDKSNGYIFAGIDASVVEYSKISVRQTDWEYNRYPLALNILNHCFVSIKCSEFSLMF